MSDQLQLSAQPRTDVGKGASRRLRRLADRIPAIVYGVAGDAVAVSLDNNELFKAMQAETFYSQVLQLSVDNQKEDVIVRDVQRHPAKPRILHVDFLRVDANTAIAVHVPLHFLNEDTCVGVKTGGGIITHNVTEIEVSCLPKDIPEFVEVDMLEVDLNQVVHLSDLTLPPGVVSVALQLGEDHDLNVASVQVTRAAAEEPTDAPEAPSGEEAAAEGEESSDES